MKNSEQTPASPLTPESNFQETFGQKNNLENQNNKNAETNKEKIEKEREKVKQALQQSLDSLKDFYNKNLERLSAAEKAKISWVLNSVDVAKRQSLDANLDQYEDKVFDKDNNFVTSRPETVPIDGLVDVLELIRGFQAENKKQVELANKKLNQAQELVSYLKAQQGLDGASREDVARYLDNSAPELKSEVLALVDQWEKANAADPNAQHHDKIDPKTGKYNADFYLSEAAEASRQLQKTYHERISNQDLKIGLSPEDIQQTSEILKAHSVNYFASHYKNEDGTGKKHGIGLTLEEAKDQEKYSEREADFIDEDPDLRQILVDKYHGQINDFDKLNRQQQNIELAMLSLRDREVLQMPKEKKEVVEVATAEVPPPIKNILLINMDEIASSMAWRKSEQKLHEYFANSNFIKRAWKSFSENYYRVKFYQEALQEITQNNNLLEAIRGRLAGQEVAKHNPELKDYFEFLDDIIEQYQNQLTEAGESGDSIKQTTEVSDLVSKMVAAHASGDIREWAKLGPEYADPKLTERERVELFSRNVLASKISGSANWGAIRTKTNKNSQDSLYASNLWQVAEQYKATQIAERQKYLNGAEGPLTKEDQEKLEKALAEHMKGLRNLDIQLGAKEQDLYNNKPKGVLKFYEKAMDWTEGKWYSRYLVNPLTVGVGTALMSRGAMSAMRYTGVAAAGVAGVALSPYILPLIAGGAAGGLYRAFRANKDLKYDIARERRNETLGGDKSKLLDKSAWGGVVGRNGLRYNTVGYGEAMQFLDSIKGKKFESLTFEERQVIGNLQAMRNIERSKDNKEKLKVDFFVADDAEGSRKGSVIGLRNKLDLALQEWTPQLGNLSGVENNILTGIKQKDRDETVYRMRSSTWSGLKAAVIGVGVGAAAQEAGYIALRQVGWMDGNRSTALEYILDKSTGTADHGYLNDLLGRANNLTVEGDPNVFFDPNTGQRFTADQALEMQKTNPAFKISNLQREDWHGIGRNFKGKELQQLHTWTKDKDSVSIDVSKMMHNVNRNIDGNNTINWDKSTDPKMMELLKEMRSHQGNGTLNERMQVRIFPTGDMYDNSQGIDAGHIDDTGRLVLDSRMRNYAFDSSGKQLVKAIEVGYMDDNGEFHTLNTAVGNGNPGEIPQIPAGINLETLTPANYDFAVPLVPPGRKVFGRKGQNQADKNRQPRTIQDRLAPQVSPGVYKSNESRLRRDQANKSIAERAKQGVNPDRFGKSLANFFRGNDSKINSVDNRVNNQNSPEKVQGNRILSQKEVIGNKELYLNPLRPYFNEAGAAGMGADWQENIKKVPDEDKEMVLNRSEKLKIDFATNQRLKKDKNFQLQLLYLLKNIDQNVFDKAQSIVIVKPEKNPINAPKSLILIESGNWQDWENAINAFSRKSKKDVQVKEVITLEPVNKKKDEKQKDDVKKSTTVKRGIGDPSLVGKKRLGSVRGKVENKKVDNDNKVVNETKSGPKQTVEDRMNRINNNINQRRKKTRDNKEKGRK